MKDVYNKLVRDKIPEMITIHVMRLSKSKK